MIHTPFGEQHSSQAQIHPGLDSVTTGFLSQSIFTSCVSMSKLLNLSVSFLLIKMRIHPRVILRIQKGKTCKVPRAQSIHSTNFLPLPHHPILLYKYSK